jgi:molecular chaperone GrpE (heat shock protein)
MRTINKIIATAALDICEDFEAVIDDMAVAYEQQTFQDDTALAYYKGYSQALNDVKENLCKMHADLLHHIVELDKQVPHE